MRARLRILAGFVVAPMVATAIALVAYQTFFNLSLLPSGASIDSMDHAASLGMGTGILAVLMTVFVAVPAVLVLREHRWLSLRTMLLLGAAIGNLPLALIVAGVLLVQIAHGNPVREAGNFWEGLSGLVVRVAIGLIGGMGAAAVFWVVAFAGAHAELETGK